MGVLDIGMFLRHLTDYFVYFGTLCLFLVKKPIYSILQVARARSLIYMLTYFYFILQDAMAHSDIGMFTYFYFILQDAMAHSDIGMFWDTGVPDR